jgi:hypothetical protein
MLQTASATAQVKLAQAYNAVAQAGKVLDVSKLTANGTGWKSANYPKGDANGMYHGTKKWVAPVPVVSDNYQAYALAMQFLGNDFLPYAQEFLRLHGGQKIVRSPKVAKPPSTRRTPKKQSAVPGGFVPAPLGSRVPVPMSQQQQQQQGRVPAMPVQQMNIPTRLSPRQQYTATGYNIPILPESFVPGGYTLPAGQYPSMTQTRLSPRQTMVPTIPLSSSPSQTALPQLRLSPRQTQLPQLSPRGSQLPQLSPRGSQLTQLSPRQTQLPQLSPRTNQLSGLPQIPTLRQ